MKNLSRVFVGIIVFAVIRPDIGFAQNIPDGTYFNYNPPKPNIENQWTDFFNYWLEAKDKPEKN